MHSVEAVFSFRIEGENVVWVTPLQGNPAMYALTVCVVRPKKNTIPKEEEEPSLRPLKLSFEALPPYPFSNGLDAIPASKNVPILSDIYEHRSPKEQGQVTVIEGMGATYTTSIMSQSVGTIAHELSHGIHWHIEKENPDYAGFYVPTKGFLKIKKPKALRVDIAAFIPAELRGLEGQGRRFHQYIEDKFGKEPLAGTPMVHYGPSSSPQPQWRTCNALYLWDEWRSYLNGALAALQAEKMHGPVGFDYLTGPAEFMVYALGSMMATKEVGPDYYGSPSFEIMKDTFWYFTKETLQIIKEGSGTSLAPDIAEGHLATLFHSDSTGAKAMRSFLESEFGPDWKTQMLDKSGSDFIPKIKAAKKPYVSNGTRVILHVPEDAKVFLAGRPMSSTGVLRHFFGFWLKKREVHESYEIKIVLKRAGREHVVVQTIDLIGGQLREIDFTPHFAHLLQRDSQ